jgi:hypothetical protein
VMPSRIRANKFAISSAPFLIVGALNGAPQVGGCTGLSSASVRGRSSHPSLTGMS